MIERSASAANDCLGDRAGLETLSDVRDLHVAQQMTS